MFRNENYRAKAILYLNSDNYGGLENLLTYGIEHNHFKKADLEELLTRARNTGNGDDEFVALLTEKLTSFTDPETPAPGSPRPGQSSGE